MGVIASLRSLFDPVGPQVQLMADSDETTISAFLGRVSGTTSTTRAYRTPTVAEALSVPAIQRAVALISSTTGMLSIQGYRNGQVMDGMNGRPDPPKVILRPDPAETPYTFYSGTAANMCKYGEFVWYIANRDGDGLASALVNVPLNELRVEENRDNRRMPSYTWGTIVSTRYSPANPAGRFVHVKYPLAEPFDLRGKGPLQLCGAAASIALEAQAWAANFFGDGGYPREIIKKAGTLDPTLRDPTTLLPDDSGSSEADLLRDQWINRPNNVPRVIDDNISDIIVREPTAQGAQMLQARHFNNGDAARMFGMPGSLLEYQEPGSTLTYQNLENEFTKFAKVCLQPLYLEPIEQALSDLLTRSTAARFNVKGFLRADIKTRYNVHKIAIESGIYDPEYAQREEGIAPGDVEFAPIPFAPPQVVTIPRQASLAMRDVRCPSCKRLVTRSSGTVEGHCRHCKLAFTDAA